MTDFPARSELPLQTSLSSSQSSTSDDDEEYESVVGVRRLVAVAVQDTKLSSAASRALVEAGHFVGGWDTLEHASTVIAALDADVEHGLEAIRERARPGAAIIALVRDPKHVQGLDVRRMGAVASVRVPIVAEELVLAVAAAERGHAREREVEQLSRELDLQNHLASLGRVTAGISHEIANPLSSVMLNVETLQEQAARVKDVRGLLRRIAADASSPHRVEASRALADLRTVDDCEATLRDIDRECTRIGALIGVMNELAARKPRTLETLSLGEIAHRAPDLVPNHAREVAIEIVAHDDVRVRGSRLLLEQLLVNLVVNAAHALENLPSRKIRLHAYSAGKEGILSVRDNGPGIDLELQARIFEPFYTTRRGRGGTGLGLALCREYVRQMDGRLTLWSVPGRGACFRVHLPRVDEGKAHGARS